MTVPVIPAISNTDHQRPIKPERHERFRRHMHFPAARRNLRSSARTRAGRSSDRGALAAANRRAENRAQDGPAANKFSGPRIRPNRIPIVRFNAGRIGVDRIAPAIHFHRIQIQNQIVIARHPHDQLDLRTARNRHLPARSHHILIHRPRENPAIRTRLADGLIRSHRQNRPRVNSRMKVLRLHREWRHPHRGRHSSRQPISPHLKHTDASSSLYALQTPCHKRKRCYHDSVRVAPILFLLSTIACGAENPDPSTLTGKVLLGYQGWFTCPSDGSHRWAHWSRGVPTPETLTVDLFPDVSELDPGERCEIPGMTIDGKPAYVFSSRNAKTVLRHFQWMKQYGLDGVLVQRFVGEIPRKERDHDLVLHNVMRAAAETGRTFAIEYDISGANPATFARSIEDDWRYLVDKLHITSQPGYQFHNGKPLLSIWGMGLGDGPSHPPEDPAAALALINWFKSEAPEKYRVTYMGGVPAHWSSLTADSRTDPAWAKVYAAMDIVQPWNVGRYRTLPAVDKWKDDVIAADMKTAAANHQLYMPVAFPGFSWRNLKHTAQENQIPRLAGDFLWRQAYNAKTSGVTMLKIAMFDEVDEGTAIFKAAAHRNQAPDQGYWLTLDADGDDLPSDWYLRLAGAITKMFHNEIPPNPKPPTRP